MPPVNGGHAQEPTSLSLAETIVDSPSSYSPVGSRFSDKQKSPVIPSSISDPVSQNGVTEVLPTIPPEHDARTLVLCFDGTGDQFDADNSNIVQLVSLLKKDNKMEQMVYYQAGIGTYTAPEVATPAMSRFRKTLDEMFAWNLDAHVMSGYEFLMQNYMAGDKICIFGFSRGAYTAQSLAGMIHKVGLLPADNFQQVPFAYKMYTQMDHTGWKQSNVFKKAFSLDVPIEFVGVWDTVNSVGLFPKILPFTKSNTIVRKFRHAIALDERRSKFRPNLWNRPDKYEQKLGLKKRAKKEMANGSSSKGSGSHSGRNGSNGNKKHKGSGEKWLLRHHEREYSRIMHDGETTNVKEVWFAGCHCDVGGGSVSNDTPNSLARIPLRWMIRECFKTETGIMFDSEALKSIGLDPSMVHPDVRKRPPPLPLGTNRIAKFPPPPISDGFFTRLFKKDKQSHHHHHDDDDFTVEVSPVFVSEEEEELKDALSPKYDQLSLNKGWWILEILPLQFRHQKNNDDWIIKWRPNLGRPRKFRKHDKVVKVHRSVKLRMEAEYEDEKKKGKKYVPKPKFRINPTWVDLDDDVRSEE